MTMQAQMNGIQLYWEEHGAGQPVMLVHGFALSSAIWQRQIEMPGLHLILPDLRGHVQTDATRGPASMRVLADDLAALLDHLNRKHVTLGGLGMGGYVALAFAAKYPERLRALMLIASCAEADPEEVKQERRAMIEPAKNGGAHAIATRLEWCSTVEHGGTVVGRIRQYAPDRHSSASR